MDNAEWAFFATCIVCGYIYRSFHIRCIIIYFIQYRWLPTAGLEHIQAETKWPTILKRKLSNAYLNENVRSSIKISLEFVPKCQINNMPALAQIMAWRRPGDKPLLKQWWLDYRRIYASPGLDELTANNHKTPMCIDFSQFHQPRLVIRTFHRQGRCSRGGHLCNEHSKEKYSCSYK